MSDIKQAEKIVHDLLKRAFGSGATEGNVGFIRDGMTTPGLVRLYALLREYGCRSDVEVGILCVQKACQLYESHKP